MTALTKYRALMFTASIIALPLSLVRSFRRGYNRVKEAHRGRR